MENDRETVIRLSGMIERLRAQLKEAEQLRATRQKQLRQAERQLDQHLRASPRKQMPRSLSRMLHVTASNSASYQRPNVTADVRNFFLAHRERAFATKEVMASCSIPKSHHDAVRKALARLSHRGLLVRVGDGVYRLDNAKAAH